MPIEYRSWQDRVWKVIQGELCMGLNLSIWKKHMYNSETVLDNDMQKFIWNFEIQTDHHTISTRQPDVVIEN